MPTETPVSTTPEQVSNPATGGDLDLEALFAALEGGDSPTESGTTSSTSGTPSGEPQAPPTQTPDGYFLHAPTGTVYKTREEAEQGFAQKDTLIEDLRSKYIAITNRDPISGKMIAPAQTPEAPINYAKDFDRLYDDAADAASKGDKQRWGQVMQKLIQDQLQPYFPIVNETATNRAKQVVAQQLPDFHEVVKSETHSRVLKALPGLKNAIEAAESNPEYFGQLPELYKIEYLVAKALGSAGVGGSPPSTATPPPVRPTVSTSTLTPPGSSAQPNLGTAAGRKAIIEQGEQRGLGNLMFDNLKI